jgi:mRNA-degrading endonuclease RelE of RelBE toxin-antitoxin system
MAIKYFSFQETPDFTKRLLKLMEDDDYAEFQISLAANPSAGDLIPGGDGLRKVRWRGKGRGKRGGVRIIYYLIVKKDSILLLDIYSKNEKTDISKKELSLLVDIKRKEIG